MRTSAVRTCVGCRTRALAAELLRVVVSGDSVVPDPRRRLPGRGAWLHPDPECLRLAERRRAFPRALRFAGPLDTAPIGSHLAKVARLSTDEGTSPSCNAKEAGRPIMNQP
ncbi:YlxR family protein [Allokutzneria multivorans]|uniref:YlxR family protein n=1 Tax=Allokutzneria multivorans TaxID=1142134 RepID=A0ABP7TIU6_9PSEU